MSDHDGYEFHCWQEVERLRRAIAEALAETERIDHVDRDAPYPTRSTPMQGTGHPFPGPGHAELHQAQYGVIRILREALHERR